MTFEEFLARLDGVRRAGSGYVAVCPSHADSEASLGVSEGEDRILLNCYAGCLTEDIVRALNIELRDLFYTPRGYGEPERVYQYRDESGTVLFEALRYPGKRFKQRHYQPDSEDAKEDGYVYSLDGVRRVLYRLPELLATHLGATIYVVEGEKDVESLEAIGKTATCNPMGAGKGKFLPEFVPFFAGRNVIVVCDKDDVGRKHAEAIRQILEPVALNVFMLQARKGKDVTDHLAAGLSLEDLQPMRERAKRGLMSSREMRELAISDLARRPEDRKGVDNPWGIDGLEFVSGRLYLLGAKTSGGKTSWSLQLYRYLCEQGRKPLFCSMEMTRTDLKNRILCHRGFSLRQVERPWEHPELHDSILRSIEEWAPWEGEIVFETDANAERCEELVSAGSFDFLIFDHIHQISSVAGGEEGQIAQEIRQLRNIALDYDIPVLALSQFKRPIAPGMRPTIYDFKGSSAIEQNATMALALHSGEGPNYELIVLKNRDGRQGVTYPLAFDGPRFSFRHGGVYEHVTNAAAQSAEPPAPF